MVTVLFFAQLKEQLGCDKLSVDVDVNTTVERLKQQIVQTHPEWQTHLANKKLLMAVNQDMASGDVKVNDGDEVAFFPPVTGG